MCFPSDAAQVCLEIDVYNKLDTEQVRLLGFLSPLLIHQVITATTKTTKGNQKIGKEWVCVWNYLWRFAFGGSMMFFMRFSRDEWTIPNAYNFQAVIPLLFGNDVVKEEG